MLKKRIVYWYMRTAARLGHVFTSDWYKVLGNFERPTSDQLNMIEIPIEKKIDAPSNFILPKDIMFALIDKAACTGIIHTCSCRTSAKCKDYPQDIACVVMGSTVETLDPAIGRIVSKDEAKEHVVKALDLGLFPAISHYSRDAQMYSLEFEKLLTLCFCCDCCCTIRNTVKATDGLDNSFFSNTHKLPFVHIELDLDKCTGCRKCEDICMANAIVFEDGKPTLIEDKCKGCGKCALVCDAYTVCYETDDLNKIIDEMHITSDFTS